MLLSQSEKQIMLLVDGYGYCVEPIPGLGRKKLNKRQAFFSAKFKENNVPRSRNKQRTKPGNETIQETLTKNLETCNSESTGKPELGNTQLCKPDMQNKEEEETDENQNTANDNQEISESKGRKKSCTMI